ncbi:sll0787 family AIR synthase-like protein [Kovacikia minuta CCNUW1]|uniref:sll0787 family AIR synthase-like protein n=1 Tax=Kovacikia minuta TaxID=2931930 RepID=UPI001CCCCB2E|nr:sll0787 family AIR synthase-like protein [Kovacikia minuta]UBF26893.1 sll0787 family AIR synthase-like protein [Kovacikia minuta CCNUW1]
MLATLVAELRQSLGILQKRDIQMVAEALTGVREWKAEGRGQRVEGGSGEWGVGSGEGEEMKVEGSPQSSVLGFNSKFKIQNSKFFSPPHTLLGDDCAAIPDRSGYLLFAAEGILPALVEAEPWFAGWCAVMVNVSDIYAMGGKPIAIVDTLWSQSPDRSAPLLDGMKAAAETYHVPIVGGHTNGHSPYNALSVAILGRAQRLITSFNARPGDRLLIATDFRGKPYGNYPFWNAATEADPFQLRGDLAILPFLAESGLCDAGKDISMGGIIGTLLMLLETSGWGAVLNLDQVPCPVGLTLKHWLLCFPSYGFLLSVRPEQVAAVQAHFHQRDLMCEVVGEVQPTHQLVLQSQDQSVVFWDLSQQKLTGFSPA